MSERKNWKEEELAAELARRLDEGRTAEPGDDPELAALLQTFDTLQESVDLTPRPGFQEELAARLFGEEAAAEKPSAAPPDPAPALQPAERRSWLSRLQGNLRPLAAGLALLVALLLFYLLPPVINSGQVPGAEPAGGGLVGLVGILGVLVIGLWWYRRRK